MEAAVDQGIAWQIKINRERRGLSQKQLASKLGTQQSAISRLEDPDYGSHSLESLKQVASAFDCALLLKLVPFSVLAAESEKLSPDDLFAAPFDQEVLECP
ncbi:Helix-turn-helix domain-containing protein [Roseateles sp. YR242]|nr:Helix-turn-helix domain-containing protein [Roseateles sp. YR242]